MGGGKANKKGTDKGAPLPNEGEENGNILIRDLWTQGEEIIHNMHALNTDAVSYQSKTPEKFLEISEK